MMLSQDVVLAELARRALIKQNQTNFLRDAFAQQINFIEDNEQFKICHCPRGAAKSYTAGLGIYKTMQDFPGCNCIYVTKTHDMARNIMWKNVMKQIDSDFSVGMAFNESLLEGRHPNGAIFRLVGIDSDAKQQDKLLGGKYQLVILDEVAFFDTDLTSIIYRTLIPAAGRVGGAIWMMSTSSDLTRGLFYEATRPEKHLRTPGWKVHEWSWQDNPYIRPEMEATLEKIVSANPLIVKTNHFRQMYLNEWTIDESKLVYRFNPDLNVYKDLPKLGRDGWTYILGIDFGWEDDNAFVLTGYHINDPVMYVLETFKKPRMTFDEIIAVTRRFMANTEFAPHRIVVDVAAKQGVESMRQRSGIPFEYAEKQGKVEFIEQLNGDLVTGNIKLHTSHAELVAEMTSLVWKTEGDRIAFPKKEHPSIPNHLCDALLYNWRSGYHYSATLAAEKKIVFGSREWYQKQSDDIWAREREHLIAGMEEDALSFGQLG